MIVLVVMVVGAILIGTAAVVAVLRGWGQEVGRTEAELHESGARTLAYDVPPGRDPAELMAALTHAGYRAIEENPGRLLIACPQADDSDKVRGLLASA